MICDPQCGANCELTDDSDFNGTHCLSDCEDCIYQSEEIMLAQGEFWDGDYCYFNAQCTEDGILYDAKVPCGSEGEVYDGGEDDTQDLCFTDDPADCDDNNLVCDSQENFPVDCVLGNPGAGDNYCIAADEITCYYMDTGLCAANGWDYHDDEMDYCDYGSVAAGFCLDGEDCYKDVICDETGLSAASTQNCPEPSYFPSNSVVLMPGELCWYELHGNMAGREDDCSVTAGCQLTTCTTTGNSFTCKRPEAAGHDGCYQ